MINLFITPPHHRNKKNNLYLPIITFSLTLIYVYYIESVRVFSYLINIIKWQKSHEEAELKMIKKRDETITR